MMQRSSGEAEEEPRRHAHVVPSHELWLWRRRWKWKQGTAAAHTEPREERSVPEEVDDADSSDPPPSPSPSPHERGRVALPAQNGRGDGARWWWAAGDDEEGLRRRGGAPVRSRCLRAVRTCQWFLTALSVRPGKRRAMSAHLLPWARCAATSRCSSAAENGRRLTRGSSWLNHRSRQLFPAPPIFRQCVACVRRPTADQGLIKKQQKKTQMGF
uniref:Uncharacterized protein n=1 Tax=Zea mays TaxID=4577 RepID=A0A804N232_MAIZE